MAALAVLPVHAIYAGFVLRESLVALMSILAVWALTEIWHAEPAGRRSGAGPSSAGLLRRTGRDVTDDRAGDPGGAGLFGVVAHGRRRFSLWWPGAPCAVVCLPWAWAPWMENGSPFYSYTQHFEYNFSWVVHHYEKGNTLPSQFYTRENLPGDRPGQDQVSALDPRRIDDDPGAADGAWASATACQAATGTGAKRRSLVATIFVVFVLATLKRVADVNQVAQLGRYYMPVFVLVLPTAVSGIFGWLDSLGDGRRRAGGWPSCVVRSCGQTRPGHTTRRGWWNAYQVHWPALGARANGSRKTPPRCLPRRGS